jgi:hypothetical protein
LPFRKGVFQRAVAAGVTRNVTPAADTYDRSEEATAAERLTMRFSFFLILATSVLILTSALPARAVYDVSPRLITSAGRLATYGYDDAGDSGSGKGNPIYLTSNPLRVFPYSFGNFNFDLNFDQDPGIHALSSNSAYTPSGLPVGSWMSFDVLSGLQYWNGTSSNPNDVSFGAAPGGETIQLSFDASPSQVTSVTIGTTGPSQPDGFVIDSVGTGGAMHDHLSAEIQAGPNEGSPANGVYLFEMRLNLLQSDRITPYPGVAPSLPFFVMYSNNIFTIPSANYLAAQTWVTNNLVPFGDFNRDGKVNAADISTMMNALTNLNGYETTNHLTNFDLMAFGDINSDGKFNNADLQALLNLFKTGQYALVPEPSSFVLLAIGSVVLAWRLRRSP